LPAQAAVSGVVFSFSAQPSATAAGSSPDFTASIALSSTSASNSVKDVTVTLPPGLLASTAAVTQTCSAAQVTALSCPAQALVGTGTVVGDGGQINANLNLYLTPPPNPSKDLAGVAGIMILGGNPVASLQGAVDLGTSNGLPVGVLTISNIPNSFQSVGFYGTSLTVKLNGKAADASGNANAGAPLTRLPTSCSPATTTLTVDTYDSSTTGTASDSFTPTGCSSLPYSPQLSASATKDAADNGVSLTADLTQAAGEADTQNASLTFPVTVLQPNLNAAVGLLNSTTPVGTATVTSPLVSQPLSASIYLTGTITSPALTITAPPPFSFTISAPINLGQRSITLQNVPDVPISDLHISIPGGPNGVFITTCGATSAAATVSLSAWSGATVNASPTLSLTGCPPAGGTTGGGGGTTGGGSGPQSGGTTLTGPSAAHASLTGLASGKPKLSFSLASGSFAVKSFTVKLPSGLKFVSNKKTLAKAIRITGAAVKSLALSGGSLVVTLTKPATSVSVTIGAAALTASKSLTKNARKLKAGALKVTVTVTNALSKTTTLPTAITKVG
jgi:hypothetical protein